MNNFPLITHLTTPLTSRICLFPRSPKYTHLILLKKTPARPSLKNISRLVVLSPPNLHKLPHFSLSPRKMELYAHAKIIDT